MGFSFAPAVIAASAARTSTGQTGTLPSNFGDDTPAAPERGVLNIAANVTAVSGTSPSMTLSVEWSDDNGATWFQGDPADAFTAITATGNKVKQFVIKALSYRVVWTITGTTPSFTFALRATSL